jgi:pimeloyl-ACP methyl ester carboxylesterase
MVDVLKMKKNILYLLSVLLITSCSMQKSITNLESFDDINYPYQVNKIKLDNDITIGYMDEGNGSPIVFIHGLGSYSPAWKKTIEGLKSSHRCIAIDLPGYGVSSKGKYDCSMTFYADVVADFINKMQLKDVTLAGHSMGGQISIMTSLAYPNKVAKLMLVAPAGFELFTPGQKQWFREVLTPKAVKLTPVDALISNVAYNFYDFPDDAQFMIDDRIAMRSAKEFDAYCYTITQSVSGMVDQPIFEYLPKIDVPTLVVYGKQDNLIPNRFLNPGRTEDIAKAGANQIKNSQLEMVDKAGHFVHFEQAEIVNQIMINFLKN